MTVANMAIPVLPWRHRYSASAAAPGRFIEAEGLSPTVQRHWDDSGVFDVGKREIWGKRFEIWGRWQIGRRLDVRRQEWDFTPVILRAGSDKKHMPNCQGLWRHDLHFLTALFYAAIFCKWPQALHLHCHLERSCLLVSGEIVLRSMKTLSREISPYHGASPLRSEISPPGNAFVEMTSKGGE